MPNFSQAKQEYLFLTKETTYGQAVTPGNNNYCRAIKSPMSNTRKLLRRRDKTGTRSVLKGTQGRYTAKWQTEMSLVTSGSTGVPDCDVLLQMLFGQAATSRLYTLTDSIVSGNLWSFRDPSSLDQRVTLGSILQTATFTLGADVAEWTADGIAEFMLGSNGFSAADTIQKGGLGSFPSRPGSPVANGDLIAGFTGAISVDSVSLAELKTATIKVNTGNALVEDSFGFYNATGAEGDDRNISLSFVLDDNDSSGHETLKEAADSKVPVSAVITVGTVTNNKYTFTLNGLQLESPALDDNQRRFRANYGDSPASASAIGVLDEFNLQIS